MKSGLIVMLLIAASALSLSGCAPVAIGAYAYHTAERRESRQEFIESLNATNLEREKAGLQPISSCTAKMQYDAKWAQEDPTCR